jgi:site-specific DNA recombinase
VKMRQAQVLRAYSDPHTTMPLNDQRRPRFLLSGLLICRCCGGGYTIRAKDRYGCANHFNRGTCQNGRTINRFALESRVLTGLKQRLLTPDLVAEFVKEFQVEWNRLQAERQAEHDHRARRLADVERRISAIIDAIERGIITATTKERLEALEAEKVTLTTAPTPAPTPSIHPNLAQVYRDKVARLEAELADPAIAADAKSVLRSLIDKIVLIPGEKRGEIGIELHGELANILTLGTAYKNKRRTGVARVQLSVVAGVGFEPTTFRL